MRTYLLILLATLSLMGCKKDGSKSAVLEGREIPAASDPKPTDINFPEPELPR